MQKKRYTHGRGLRKGSLIAEARDHLPKIGNNTEKERETTIRSLVKSTTWHACAKKVPIKSYANCLRLMPADRGDETTRLSKSKQPQNAARRICAPPSPCKGACVR